MPLKRSLLSDYGYRKQKKKSSEHPNSSELAAPHSLSYYVDKKHQFG